MAEKNYANGVFAKHFEGKYGVTINIGIDVDKFVDWLTSLDRTKGFVNVKMTRQKDPSKWTMFEDTWKPGQLSGSSAPKKNVDSYKTAPKKAVPVDDTDDLPF